MVCNTFLSYEFIYMHTSTCVLSCCIYDHDNIKVKFIRIILPETNAIIIVLSARVCSQVEDCKHLSNFYYTRYIFCPRVILYNFFLFFAHLWWFLFGAWGLRFGFSGWGFQLMGFGACGVGPSGYFELGLSIQT